MNQQSNNDAIGSYIQQAFTANAKFNKHIYSGGRKNFEPWHGIDITKHKDIIPHRIIFFLYHRYYNQQ